MSNKTKTVRHTKRFGARYGVSIKKRVEEIEAKQRQKHLCPQCGFKKVKRISTGIFSCKKCSHTFAGGAFYPQTMTGNIIQKMVTQKAFLANMASLIQAQESKQEKSYQRREKEEKKTHEERVDELVHMGKSKEGSKATEEGG